jgi:hypothetical protein
MELTAFGFDMNYQAASLAEPAPHKFQRQASRAEGTDLVLRTPRKSTVIEVVPTGKQPWFGEFENGPEGLHGIFATPDPNTVCVVATGQGYWVSVVTPENYAILPLIPIKRVISIPEQKALIFLDYTKLAAYGPNGIKWLTGDLSWDGLEIIDVTSDKILGKSWDAPSGRHVPFSVDIDSGRSHGGSSPAMYGVDDSKGSSVGSH